MKIYMIVADVDCDRTNLESIEGNHYKSLDEFRESEEYKYIKSRGNFNVMPLYEFTTDWNDTDDDGTYLDIHSSFISYITTD